VKGTNPSSPHYGAHGVLCGGHQKVLIVGGLNHHIRHYSESYKATGMAFPVPLSSDASNMGAAICVAETQRASVVAWVDRLGDPISFQAVRMPELGGWRRVIPPKTPQALFELFQEIETRGVEVCRGKNWWTVSQPDGKYAPCPADQAGAQPDLGRWRYWRDNWQQDAYEGRKPPYA